MSLINKMLQDLDARNASAAERAALSPQLRALPPEKTFSWRGPAFAVAGALVGATAVWFALQPEPAPVPPPVAQAPVSPVPSPAPAAPVEPTPLADASVLPTLTVPLPAESEPIPAIAAKSAKPAPTIGKGLGLNPSLKVDMSLGKGLEAGTGGAASAEGSTGTGRVDKQIRGTQGAEAADAEYRKAIGDIRRGAMTEGTAGLRRALQLEPRFAQARQALLSVLIEHQQWADAQAVCTEGLALDPGQSGWAMILARLQVEKGDTAQAADTLAQYAARAERNADYQAFHALLLQRLQRPKEAAGHYQAALALRPNEGRWWYGLGLAQEAAQQPQEARAAFQKARESGNLPAELAAAVEQKLR